MPAVDLSTLPANAQQELLDFYEFLQEKYVGRKPVLWHQHCITRRPQSISKPL